MPIFSLKCFRTDTQVARNRVRGFGLLKPHTVPARIVSPLSGAFSTLSAFQVESVEQPCPGTRTGGYGRRRDGRGGGEPVLPVDPGPNRFRRLLIAQALTELHQ